VLGRLVLLEPKQADLLARMCSSELIDSEALCIATAKAMNVRRQSKAEKGPTLFSG
jgi:hypothetical protein